MRIIDLSYVIKERMPVYPGTPEVEIKQFSRVKNEGYAEKEMRLGTHTGTHMDAPAHMIEGEKTLDQFFLSKFTGRACLIPFSHDDLEGKDKVEYLSGFESVIRDSEFVILYTGWSKRWGNDDYFANFPALDKNSAEYLSGFHLKAIGIDAISIDMADSENFEAHHTLLSQEILIIENLCHLDEIRQSSFLFSAFPLLIEGSDGSPVRAMASYE